MKTNKEFIDGIYQKADEISNCKKEKKTKDINTILKMVAVFLVVFVVASITNSASLEKDKNSSFPAVQENKISLRTVENFENFCKIIKETNLKQTNANKYEEVYNSVAESTESQAPMSGDILKEDGATPDATAPNATKPDTTSPDTENPDTAMDALQNGENESKESKTNNQVENVDEADIVKVDNGFIYYVADSNKVVIIDAKNREEAKKVAEINYEDEKIRADQIYVNNNKLVVISEKMCYMYHSSICFDTVDMAREDYPSEEPKTIITIYDVSDKNNITQIRKIEIEGTYLSSRMIGNNVYFAATKGISTQEILKEDVQNIEATNYQPKYKDTVVGEQENCISYDSICYFKEIETVNYLMLAGLNLNSNEEVKIQTFLGAGSTIYCSEKNMYIAKTNTKYDEKYNFESSSTHIFKFALNDGNIEFKAEAEVEGSLNNQFSMDESKEYFRIATTIGEPWQTTEQTSNNLYVLDSNLEEVGKLTGFGKEEKIYSVRYVGTKAYIVTFKQTDPLFVIDLSDPANPQILGELKLPGYSTYLHPYDETHIIGIGYDTREDGSRITTDGLKMVMFDVSDLSNPKQLFKTEIADRNTSSEITYNHKSILYSKEKNIIAFPLTTYTRNKTYTRAAIYEISLESGFTLKGEIANEEYKDHNQLIKRIVYIDNTYYTLSTTIVKSADMETLQIIKKIDI